MSDTAEATHADNAAASTQPGLTIVVGYDGSEASRAALRFAARQAPSGGCVVIVHAYELPSTQVSWVDYGSLLSRRYSTGDALLSDLPLGDSDLAGPHYETELHGGPAARAIMAVAQTRHADEIVVGARRRGQTRAELGSVSQELLDIADCPVTVIPAPDPQR